MDARDSEFRMPLDWDVLQTLPIDARKAYQNIANLAPMDCNATQTGTARTLPQRLPDAPPDAPLDAPLDAPQDAP